MEQTLPVKNLKQTGKDICPIQAFDLFARTSRLQLNQSEGIPPGQS